MHRHRFDLLLAALVLLLFAMPIVRLLGLGSSVVTSRIVLTVVFTAMLIAAVYAVRQSRRSVTVSLLLGVPAFVLQGLSTWLDREALVISAHLLVIAFLGYVVVVILKFLFAEKRVTSNVIFASLCVYLLLGVTWAEGYSLLEVAEPGSFRFAYPEDMAAGRMRIGGEHSLLPLYYSFVTMTTLGYGDIVPVSSAARMLAAVEAVMGQLYLAVLVARLVGLHISQTRSGD
ncbi:MAG: two pore domain potassium channel family protein [Candidatus Nealsonbacteria bacterium]|nr:two pore domain potassium channel family protein [Candidatus Nealsonbacteria bacterium]